MFTEVVSMSRVGRNRVSVLSERVGVLLHLCGRVQSELGSARRRFLLSPMGLVNEDDCGRVTVVVAVMNGGVWLW